MEIKKKYNTVEHARRLDCPTHENSLDGAILPTFSGGIAKHLEI
jgi:hypothetical protein